jgi:acyl carrier protein
MRVPSAEARRDRVVQLLFQVIDDLNQNLPRETQLSKSVDTPLFGEESLLDSLGLVNLIVGAEDKIQEEFNTTITIADERVVLQQRTPFRTVETLANHICQLLDAESDNDDQGKRW